MQTAAATTTVASATATATKAMAGMQKTMNPAEINKTMQQFSKENAKMEMTSEMMNDTIDNALDDDETEEETGELVSQVSLWLMWYDSFAFGPGLGRKGLQSWEEGLLT
jgi:division protein CdvB (Snf7/Vps24/ESCRT-III family)